MARLLFLTSSFPDSPEDGVCGYVLDLARTLAELHHHEVRVLAPHSPGAVADGAFAPVTVERFQHPWPFEHRLNAGTDIGRALRSSRVALAEGVAFTTAFRRAARRASPWADAVCSHWLVPAGAIGAGLGRPHVAVAHGGDVRLLERMTGGPAILRSIANRSRIVCVSRDLAARVSRLTGDDRPLPIVPMGAAIGPALDAEAVRRIRNELDARERFVALFLGRLVPMKGADILVEAAAGRPDIDVWIAGEGPEVERLRGRARAARLRVSFLGRIDRTRRRAVLAACDAVVVPSRTEEAERSEGSPVVCAEGFQAGRPVVASNVGGLAEMIEHEHNGLLVPPDDPASLGLALDRLRLDPELRQRLASNAASTAPDFSMTTTANRFNAILESELGR